MSNTYSNGKRNFKTVGDLALFLRKKHSQSYGNKKFTPWRKIAEYEFDGVSPGTLCRIAKDDYDPHNRAVRAALGLPIYITVTVCAECGSRHDEIKTCPSKRKPRRPRKPWVPPLLAAIRAAYREMTAEEVDELRLRRKT